jgi:lipopolysaccharide export system ATP-binding protein
MKHRLPTAKIARVKSPLAQPELLADEKRLADAGGGEVSPVAPLPDFPAPTSVNDPAETPFPDAPTVPLSPDENPDPDSVEPFSFLNGPEDSALIETSDPDAAETKGAEEIISILHGDDPPVVEKRRATPPPLPFIPAKKKGPPPLPAKRPETSPHLIQTRGLVKQYGGRRVVNGVDIHVGTGEVVGLLGPNGAGKTTTFYMIVGLVPPDEGHVYMGDEDVTRMPMYRRARLGIGYLPQEESIFRKLTVEENLLAILETLPLTEEERDARCDELLKDFGLEHVRENVAITLSGGEKRRVTIARALVTSPTLLLLDEPFSGVDPMAVHDIQEIILNLKNRGLGVLITDHNVRETLSVVDRAYVIHDGRVLSEGSREFLLNDPIAREIYLGHRFSM